VVKGPPQLGSRLFESKLSRHLKALKVETFFGDFGAEKSPASQGCFCLWQLGSCWVRIAGQRDNRGGKRQTCIVRNAPSFPTISSPKRPADCLQCASALFCPKWACNPIASGDGSQGTAAGGSGHCYAEMDACAKISAVGATHAVSPSGKGRLSHKRHSEVVGKSHQHARDPSASR
jgi:hypothetical protein